MVIFGTLREVSEATLQSARAGTFEKAAAKRTARLSLKRKE
jgi:hypothetical protein